MKKAPSLNDADYVWYACYGSNLRRSRFECYLKGGQPEGSSGRQPGARNESLPTHEERMPSAWQLKFGKNAKSWDNGGVAFIQPPDARAVSPGSVEACLESGTLMRMFRIRFDQFVDVFIQENGGDPGAGTVAADITEVFREQVPTMCDGETFELPGGILDTGWYRQLVCFKQIKGEPVLSFTIPEVPPRVRPAASYLRTISLGLFEAYYELRPEQIWKYLERTTEREVGRLEHLLTDWHTEYNKSESQAIFCAGERISDPGVSSHNFVKMVRV